MKSAIAFSLLAASVLAQPHRQHMQHRAVHDQIEKRDVVWVTDWVVVTEIIDATATVFVDENGSTVSTGGVEFSTATTSAEDASTTSVTAGNFFQGASTSSTTLKTLARSSSKTAVASSTYVAPAPESTSTTTPTPTPSTSSSVYVAPAPSSTPETSSVYVAPAPSSTPESSSTYVAPETSTSAAAAATSSAASSSSSSSSGLSAAAASVGCSSGSPCTGAVTYYTAGMGSCGVESDGTTEDVVALDSTIMTALNGANPNTNPLCGSVVTLNYNGKSVDLTVVDSCPGCSGSYGLDLSEHAFKQLADESVGVFNGEWYFS